MPPVKGFEASSHVNRLASRTDAHCGPWLNSTNLALWRPRTGRHGASPFVVAAPGSPREHPKANRIHSA